MLVDSKQNAANLKHEELRVKLVQKEVAMKSTTKVMLELDKTFEPLETENRKLLQGNEERLQRSSS